MAVNTPEMVQIGAAVNRQLKREAFAIFASHELPFARWLTQKLREVVEEERRQPATGAHDAQNT